MSFAVAQCKLLSLQGMKTDCEYGLTEITHKLQQLALQSSQIAEKYAKNVTMDLVDSEDELVYAGEWDFGDYEPQMQRIHSIEKQLEAEKVQKEARLQQIDALLSSEEKAVESGIKQSFGYASN